MPAPSPATAHFGPATRAWFEGAFPGPTRVQELGWPVIASGAHALLVAPTGSGKTLAAFLAALDALSGLPGDAPPGVRVVYVSPLKALVADIERNLHAPLVGMGHAARRLGVPLRQVSVDRRTGDTAPRERERQRRRPGDVLITTPESLYLMLTGSARDTLRTVTTVLVDELHVLAATKRGAHLALSLERLSALTGVDPQRIGLSATVRPTELAARFLGGDRPVQVIDTSEPPRLALEIIVPVEDMQRPPAPPPPPPADPASPPPTRIAMDTLGPSNSMRGGLWPSIHPALLAAIRAHRSTLIFCNSRILCERLAQALNELAGAPIVAAHHGSISHERRARIEEQLKAGQLPALVATSSLELGIDMGAIDLVILVESPGSAARGLQRIGRAGHQVGVRSTGLIFPKYRGDLLESAVIAARMARGEIEAIDMPRNCLDVLAQQIVATVSVEEQTVEGLLALVRRAAPYADLPPAALTAVLDMLSGRYPSDDFADLVPTLNWDRSTDEVRARRTARRIAVQNGGTIPDRGLYRVRIGADGPTVGELDEEMVFESRVGDVIVLGATSWRVLQITRDVVEVAPAPGEPGRLAFWRGERPGRPIEVGRALGAFLREWEGRAGADAEAWVRATTPLDALAARNLVAYITEQRAATGALPSDRVVVVERFRDELGDWRLCILTPLGARVHAPWALAIEASLAEHGGHEIQALWSDDGISLRFPDSDRPVGVEALLLDPDAVEDLVIGQLAHASVLAGRFREAAGRALVLPRRDARRRTPLWLQRRRAGDLLARALRFPTFPLVLEAWRECLQEVFDLPALTGLLAAVRSREVAVVEVETPSASPFARSLVFQYVSSYLYEGDGPLAERKAAALTLDRGLLRELLGQEGLRDLLEPAVLDAVELELQALTDDRRARHADGLHDLLRRLGDLTGDEVSARCAGPAADWLVALETSRRAVRLRVAGQERWVALEDAARYRDGLGVVLPPGLPLAFLEEVPEALEGLLLRWARVHGPFTAEQPAARFGLPVGPTAALLRALTDRNLLLHGELRPGGTRREWCDPEVLRRLRRRTLAHLRKEVAPVEPEVFARFLPAWHGLDRPTGGLARLEAVVDQLEGLALPWSVLEGEVLPARVSDYRPAMLDQLGAMGVIVWLGRGAAGPKDGHVVLVRRERVALLWDPLPVTAPQGPLHDAVLAHLSQRGASFVVELQVATGARAEALEPVLWDLVWSGQITNDTFQPLRQLRGPGSRLARLGGGRWSAVAALRGPTPDATPMAIARASVLLERHGVVSREAAHLEERVGGFSTLYPVLRALEEAGRVRRGWFVAELGGAQFALPGAIDRLRACRAPDGQVRVLAAADPAQVWGGHLPWPATARADVRLRREAGAKVVLVDGVPALYLSRGGRGLHVFQAALDASHLLDAAVSALATELGYRSLRVERLDGVDPATSPSHGALLQAGLRRDHKGLVLTGRGA